MSIVTRNSACQAAKKYASVLFPETPIQKGAVFTTFATSLVSPFAAAVLGTCYISYKWSTTKASVPSFLYHPKIPKPSYLERETLSAQMAQVKEVAGRVIGFSCVFRKDAGEWIPVVITEQALGKSKTIKVFAYYSSQDPEPAVMRRIGYATTNVEKPKEDRAYIRWVENSNREQFKYVGYLLVKVVQEIYKNSCHGQIVLESLEKAVSFYQKFGFVFSPIEEQDEQAGEAVFSMYLPAQAAAAWVEEVERNPVLLDA